MICTSSLIFSATSLVAITLFYEYIAITVATAPLRHQASIAGGSLPNFYFEEYGEYLMDSKTVPKEYSKLLDVNNVINIPPPTRSFLPTAVIAERRRDVLGVYICPSVCVCVPSAGVVKCMNQNITKIPDGIPSNTTWLQLDNTLN